MDGRTLKRFGGYNIIPRHILCGGVKKKAIFEKQCFGPNQKFGSWRLVLENATVTTGDAEKLAYSFLVYDFLILLMTRYR